MVIGLAAGVRHINAKKMGVLAVIKILYKKSVDLLTDSDFVRGEGFWGSPPGPIFLLALAGSGWLACSVCVSFSNNPPPPPPTKKTKIFNKTSTSPPRPFFFFFFFFVRCPSQQTLI